MIAGLLLPFLASGLDAALDVPAMSGASVAAVVTDMSGKVLYERNPSLRLMPASNQKLLIGAFALDTLGPDFSPKTRIWVESKRVIVDAPGDPSMTFDKLADAKHRLGLTGKLPVYVRQAYAPGVAPSWEHDDLPNRYAAPVTAFSFDQGGFEIWAQNGRAFFVPGSFGVKLVRGSRAGKPKVRYDWVKGVVQVDGELPKERTRLDTLGLQRPDVAAASVLGRGMHTIESVPSYAPTLTLTGKPLAEILTVCLVKSDNNMAENLMLMSAATIGPLGDEPYPAARQAVTDFLVQKVGVAADDLRVYDGSGMSRHNLVTARAMVKLLVWEANRPTFPLWKSMLVDPGSGTLASRLKDVEFRGKTGTLDMVVALSGYIEGKDGARYVFSLLLNNFTCGSSTARDVADSFARTLATEGVGTPVAFSARHDPSSGTDEEPRHSDVHRLRRPDRHRDPASARTDRRAQPGDAPVHRAQRTALQPG